MLVGQPLERDYRHSHLDRGGDYDAAIAASPWDDYLARAEARHLDDLLRSILPRSIGRSLDFACGTGRITRHVEPYVFESWGVDVSDSMLERARRRCTRTEFRRIDLTRSALDAGRFDLVTAFRYFGNAEEEARREALLAINRLLGLGGWLVLDNHRNPNALARRLRYATAGARDMDLTHGKLRSLLAAAGFRIVWQRPIGAWICRDALMGAELHAREPDCAAERLFGASWLVPVAPAAVIAARKVAEVQP
jgi:SAM-dependent methyltransferase